MRQGLIATTMVRPFVAAACAGEAGGTSVTGAALTR